MIWDIVEKYSLILFYKSLPKGMERENNIFEFIPRKFRKGVRKLFVYAIDDSACPRDLLNEIDYKKYEVDLALRKKRGLLMKYIPPEVNLLDSLDPFSDNIFGKISKLFILLFSKRFYQFLYFKITKRLLIYKY